MEEVLQCTAGDKRRASHTAPLRIDVAHRLYGQTHLGLADQEPADSQVPLVLSLVRLWRIVAAWKGNNGCSEPIVLARLSSIRLSEADGRHGDHHAQHSGLC